MIAHHDDKTVISLMNDYQGEPSEFALVVPVPVVLQKGQVHIGDRELFQKIDAYSSPRLVEYYDPDPCQMMMPMADGAAAWDGEDGGRGAGRRVREAEALGVKIEAEYTVGEYDIVILSAKESIGLQTWLQLSGYKIPLGADRALEPYIRSDMKFFVAKVNLTEHQRTGLTYLRPLQFAFESPKFMLPIRLGMINSQGPQDLVVYMLTENGRVETTNYRTVKLPTGMDIPEYVRDDFGGFYKAMFDEQVKRNDMRAVFTEYVWNMGWCDPCAGPPLSRDELKSLGVFWLDDADGGTPRFRPGGFMPYRPMGRCDAGDADAAARPLQRGHISRRSEFPGDAGSGKFPGALRDASCVGWIAHAHAKAAKNYFDDLNKRRAHEAETLADLTGWNLEDVIKKAGLPPESQPKPWWQDIWGS